MKQAANIHCAIGPLLKKETQSILKKDIPFGVKFPNKTTIAAIEESRMESKLRKAQSLNNFFQELSK